MEDAGIHDICSCNRVPGIYTASWYSVTSGKTEIGFSFVALQKEVADFVEFMDLFRSSLRSLQKSSHYIDYTDLRILSFISCCIRDLSHNLKAS